MLRLFEDFPWNKRHHGFFTPSIFNLGPWLPWPQGHHCELRGFDHAAGSGWPLGWFWWPWEMHKSTASTCRCEKGAAKVLADDSNWLHTFPVGCDKPRNIQGEIKQVFKTHFASDLQNMTLSRFKCPLGSNSCWPLKVHEHHVRPLISWLWTSLRLASAGAGACRQRFVLAPWCYNRIR